MTQDVGIVGRRTNGRKFDGRKSNGRKSVAQRQRSSHRSSPVSFVAMAMATWSCSGASSRCYSTVSSRRCSTASSQRYNAAACVATVLWCCCSTCRGSVAALLQHASRQRCCSSRRCGTIAAGVVATLRRCFSSRCGAVVTHSNDRKQHIMQRWQAALVLVATAGRATKQVASAEFFCFVLFFFTRQFQRENESKTERKETGLRNLFPGFVGWQAPSCQFPPSTSTPFSGSSNTSTLRQQQHSSTLQ